MRFSVGNGVTIYEKTIIPAIKSAERELIFVTCFWAPSSALSQLSAALFHLSEKALSRNDGSRIRVRLCFSSRSLLQKVFHTSSPKGYLYPPSKWTYKLSLPPPEQLKGLDLQIKSIFIRPFSVMHPKFVIVDAKEVFMPSCNLSWENWLEGCLLAKGPIVDQIIKFWQDWWAFNDPPLPSNSGETSKAKIDHQPTVDGYPCPGSTVVDADCGHFPVGTALFNSSTVPTILLPSPPHDFLSTFHPLRTSPAPSTPLNSFLLHHFSTAQKSIRIFTPNLTSPPVLDALLAALARGIDLIISTSRRMMLLEQIVTAGTITEYCVWKLVRAYRRLLKMRGDPKLLEEGQALGKLKIRYFIRKNYSRRHSWVRKRQPVKSHFKCTIIDEKIVILGSGNMDRASWYTSQELGIALFGEAFVEGVGEVLARCYDGREEVYYEYGS